MWTNCSWHRGERLGELLVDLGRQLLDQRAQVGARRLQVAPLLAEESGAFAELGALRFGERVHRPDTLTPAHEAFQLLAQGGGFCLVLRRREAGLVQRLADLVQRRRRARRGDPRAAPPPPGRWRALSRHPPARAAAPPPSPPERAIRPGRAQRCRHRDRRDARPEVSTGCAARHPLGERTAHLAHRRQLGKPALELRRGAGDRPRPAAAPPHAGARHAPRRRAVPPVRRGAA